MSPAQPPDTNPDIDAETSGEIDDPAIAFSDDAFDVMERPAQVCPGLTRAVGDRAMERLLAQGVREREPDEDETGEARRHRCGRGADEVARDPDSRRRRVRATEDGEVADGALTPRSPRCSATTARCGSPPPQTRSCSPRLTDSEAGEILTLYRDGEA